MDHVQKIDAVTEPLFYLRLPREKCRADWNRQERYHESSGGDTGDVTRGWNTDGYPLSLAQGQMYGQNMADQFVTVSLGASGT